MRGAELKIHSALMDKDYFSAKIFHFKSEPLSDYCLQRAARCLKIGLLKIFPTNTATGRKRPEGRF